MHHETRAQTTERIRMLLARWCHTIDNAQPEAWAACFAPDGSYERRVAGADPVRVVGYDALLDYARGAAEARGRDFRHWVSNVVIDQDDDGWHASCYVAYTRVRPKPVEVVATGAYADRLVLIDGNPRISARILELD